MDWCSKGFGKDYLRAYRLSPLTVEQVDGVEKLLGLERGARILDLCCGYGRHAVELARRGYAVVGADLSDVLLRQALSRVPPGDPAVRFVRADMRALPFGETFDAAVNLFTSFGYFDSEAEDVKVLHEVRRCLRPRGRLLLDLLNKEWLMRHFTPRYWEEGEEDHVVLNNLAFDFVSGRLENRRFLIAPDGTRREMFIAFRVYTLAELVRLLREAGLRHQATYGDFRGADYGMDAFRMIVVARREG